MLKLYYFLPSQVKNFELCALICEISAKFKNDECQCITGFDFI